MHSGALRLRGIRKPAGAFFRGVAFPTDPPIVCDSTPPRRRPCVSPCWSVHALWQGARVIEDSRRLRAGFVMSAVKRGANLIKITDVTGHRSLVDMLKTYSRDAEAFVDHADAGLL
jgi:hypothetical protein